MSLLRPQITHFRKRNRKALRHNAYERKSNALKFGTHGIQAVEKGFLTARQIESVRRTISARLKRKGKVWIRCFPHNGHTAKPKEVRRGRGKGNIDFWFARIKPGRVLYEVKVSHRFLTLVKPALRFALRKLPVFAKVIDRTSAFGNLFLLYNFYPYLKLRTDCFNDNIVYFNLNYY